MNLREAQLWQNRVRYKRDKKTFYIGEAITIEMMFQAWLDDSLAKENSQSYTARCQYVFRKYLKPFYGSLDMSHITIEEHKKLLVMLRKKGLKPASANRVRTLMCRLFNLAIIEQHYDRAFTSNPINAIKKFKEPDAKTDYWSLEELTQFLKSEKNAHFYPLWILMINTGMRLGEAVATEVEQFDLQNHLLIIDRHFCQIDNKIVLRTKSGKNRHVAITPIMQAVLYPLIKLRKVGRLFTKEDGSFLREDYIIKTVFPRACKKAEVKNIGSHAAFRHTFGSHYMMNGGQLWDLQKILGHESSSITDKRYAHFSNEHIAKRGGVFSIGEKI